MISCRVFGRGLGSRWPSIAHRAFLSNAATLPFHYISDFQSLSRKIDSELAPQLHASPQTVVDAITACRNLQSYIHSYDKFWADPTNVQIRDKIVAILGSPAVEFDEPLLRKVLTLQLPAQTTLAIVRAYYERHPGAYISKDVAFIGLRQMLFNADLQSALTLTDLTCGHPNYIRRKNHELRLGAAQLVLSTIGIGALLNMAVSYGLTHLYLPEAWSGMLAVYAMVCAYIVNSAFFAAVVKFGRVAVAGGGDYLTWQKGTFYTHWWRHADEMTMCSKILETDIALNGTGSALPELLEELCRSDETLTNGRTLQPGYTREGKKVRLLAPKDNLNEVMLQAYWMSGGEGFEWVEPDQDPADIMWRAHLRHFEAAPVGGASAKPLKWADDLLAEEKGLQ